MTSRWAGVVLGVVLVAAGALRYPATQRGFLHWDEAQFLFGVEPGVLAAREAAGLTGAPRLFPEPAPFDRERVPYWAFSAKPGYDLLVTLYGVVVGLTPASVGWLSLAFGLGTIGLVYAVVRRVFGRDAAMASALVLSVSSYHVFYSGSQSAVAMSAFFLMLAVLLYFKAAAAPTWWRFALVGGCLGYAYGVHYNLLVFVLAVIGVCGLRLLFDRAPGDWSRYIVMGLAFGAVIGVFEAFYRVIIPFAYSHVPDAKGAYLAQLRYQLGFFGWTMASGVDRFSRLLIDSEGVLVCGLAVAGFVFTLIRRHVTWESGLLLLMAAAFFSSATLGAAFRTPVFPRMTVAFLPFVAIWAGVGIVQAVDLLRARGFRAPGAAALALALLVAVVGVPRAWASATLQSGHEAQARYVREHGDGQQVSLGLPVDQYYLGAFQGTYSPPLTLEGLRELHERTGVRLLVLDYRVNVLEEWGHPLGPVLREFEHEAVPEAVIPNPIGAALVVVGEDAQSRRGLESIRADERSAQIRIYDLRALLDRPGSANAP